MALSLLTIAPVNSQPLMHYQDMLVDVMTTPGAVASQQYLSPLACPDISVEGSQMRLADGDIVVTFKVINHSSADFVGRAGMQQLLITTRGSAAAVAFSKIGRREEVVWRDVFHADEFPATYSARLMFAPEVFSDGRWENDDCALHNNHAAVEVSPQNTRAALLDL